MFRQRKRCYDVTLSRQEGSTTRHLASAQSKDRLAGGDTGRLFLTFGGPVSPTGVSNCPLDRVLTYKNLIYLLNLQFSVLLRLNITEFNFYFIINYITAKLQTIFDIFTPHPWCLGGRAVGNSLSGLYLRNRKV